MVPGMAIGHLDQGCIAFGTVDQFDEVPDSEAPFPADVAEMVAKARKPFGVAAWVDGKLVKWLVY